MKTRYGIVGGGISGLVAAYRIRAAVGDGPEIVLFDPADRLGGVLRTETLAGQTMDVGAEAFVSRRPEVPALLAELGLTDRQIVPTGVRPTIYSRGRLHALPPDTVNGIPGAASSMEGLVDAATLAKIAAEPARALDWRPGSDPAVGALVAERFGEQVVARSLDPMLAGVYAGSAGGIGVRSAAPTVAAALDGGASSLTAAVRQALPGGSVGPVFGAIDGGYQVLLRALIDRGGSRRETAPVVGIDAGNPGWVLSDGSGRTWQADAVVIAVSAPQAARLLAAVAPAAAAAAARIQVASAAVLAMAVPSGTPFPPQSGVLVATGENLHAKAITLTSRKWGSGGRGELLRMSFGRLGDGIARNATEDELRAWARADLAAVFGIDVEPLEARVYRWIDALPQYGPGHAAIAAEIRSGLPPGLAVTGNYLDGVGVPACISAAGRAAAAVLAAVAR